MLAIEKWGEGRFKPIVMLAELVVRCVEECYEATLLSREDWLLRTSEAMSISQDRWLKCYNEPLALEGVLLHFVRYPDHVDEVDLARDDRPYLRGMIVQELFAHIQETMMSGASQNNGEWSRVIDGVFRIHHRLMERIPSGDARPAIDVEKWLEQPDFVFFFCVVVPSLLYSCKKSRDV
jgi:hypothetical protein